MTYENIIPRIINIIIIINNIKLINLYSDLYKKINVIIGWLE